MKILLTTILIVLAVLACGGPGAAPAQPATPPPTLQACTPVPFAGSGDDVATVSEAQAGCTTIKMEHSGSVVFMVDPFDAGNQRMLPYANARGEYSGTARYDGQTRALEIKADGDWKITIQ